MRRKLGQLLIEAGAATASDVDNALALQSAGEPGRIGELLLQNGRINATQLAQALSAQTGLPFADLADVDPDASGLVPFDFQQQHRLVPFRLEAAMGRVHVAVTDPTGTDVVPYLQGLLQREVVLFVAALDEVESVHAVLSGQDQEGVVVGSALEDAPEAPDAWDVAVTQEEAVHDEPISAELPSALPAWETAAPEAPASWEPEPPPPAAAEPLFDPAPPAPETPASWDAPAPEPWNSTTLPELPVGKVDPPENWESQPTRVAVGAASPFELPAAPEWETQPTQLGAVSPSVLDPLAGAPPPASPADWEVQSTVMASEAMPPADLAALLTGSSTTAPPPPGIASLFDDAPAPVGESAAAWEVQPTSAVAQALPPGELAALLGGQPDPQAAPADPLVPPPPPPPDIAPLLAEPAVSPDYDASTAWDPAQVEEAPVELPPSVETGPALASPPAILPLTAPPAAAAPVSAVGLDGAPVSPTAEELFGSLGLEAAAEVAPLSTDLADEIGRHDVPPVAAGYPGFSGLAAVGSGTSGSFGTEPEMVPIAAPYSKDFSPSEPEVLSADELVIPSGDEEAPVAAPFLFDEPPAAAAVAEPEPLLVAEPAPELPLPEVGLAEAPMAEAEPAELEPPPPLPEPEAPSAPPALEVVPAPPKKSKIPSFAIPPDVPVEPRRSPIAPHRRPSTLGRIALKRVAVNAEGAQVEAPLPLPLPAELPLPGLGLAPAAAPVEAPPPDLSLPDWMKAEPKVPSEPPAPPKLSPVIEVLLERVETGDLPSGPVLAAMLRLLIERGELDEGTVATALALL